MNKVPRWVFRYVGNKTLISSVIKRIICSKTTKFSPKLAFLTIAGVFGALLMGWRAGCISQDTYLLYYKMPIPTSCLDTWPQSSQILCQDDPTWRTADTAEAEIINPNDTKGV